MISRWQKQIDEHEVELKEMIDAFTDEQMDSLRTTIEYFGGRSYSKDVFNKSTLLTDAYERTTEFSRKKHPVGPKGRDGRTEVISQLKLMLQK